MAARSFVSPLPLSLVDTVVYVSPQVVGMYANWCSSLAFAIRLTPARARRHRQYLSIQATSGGGLVNRWPLRPIAWTSVGEQAVSRLIRPVIQVTPSFLSARLSALTTVMTVFPVQLLDVRSMLMIFSCIILRPSVHRPVAIASTDIDTDRVHR